MSSAEREASMPSEHKYMYFHLTALERQEQPPTPPYPLTFSQSIPKLCEQCTTVSPRLFSCASHGKGRVNYCGLVINHLDKATPNNILFQSTFNPLSNHLQKWIGSMHIRSSLVFLSCSAGSFNVQCKQALKSMQVHRWYASKLSDC